MAKEWVSRIPNQYIQCDINKKYSLSRQFYMVYLLISRHRSYEDISYITIGHIFRIYGYKTSPHKPKAYYEIISVLEYMIEHKMIAIRQDLKKISYDTCIEINILPAFGCRENYTIISASQLDTIISCNTNKDNLLLAFLYIRSYIIHRPKHSDGTEIFTEPYMHPEAFYRNMNTMAEDIGMSKNTIIQCLEYLTASTGGGQTLLCKKEFEGVKEDKAPPLNIPNIYVLNKKGWEQEADWAYNKIMQKTKR